MARAASDATPVMAPEAQTKRPKARRTAASAAAGAAGHRLLRAGAT